MSSLIDPTKPAAVAPTTQSVRDNFGYAKSEIEALQVGNTVVDAAADTTTWPMLARTQTGDQAPTTDGGLTYNASTNALSAGEYIANGTAGGLEIQNANSQDAYQASIGGSMTLNAVTLSALSLATTISGGASTTAIRGVNLSPTLTPSANADLYNVFNNPTLNSGVSPSAVYLQLNLLSLGAAALGGTIATVYGQQVGFSANASATTNLDAFHSFRAGNVANGAAQIVTNAYAFSGAMAAGSGRWNLHMSGTAINYLGGALLIGSATDDTVNKLQVTGSATISGGLSVTGGVIDLPNYTTATRPTAATGNLIYDTTLNKACIGTGAGTWQVITST